MFKQRRQERYNKLVSAGLQRFEARELSSIPFSRMPFVKNIIRDRRNLIEGLEKEAKALGWSRTRFEKEKLMLIAWEYRDKGLTFTKKGKNIIKIKGSPDVWQMFRYYRWLAIKNGEWQETPRKKRARHYDERGIRIDKGKIREQKRKYRERQKLLSHPLSDRNRG